jgi:ACS family hexuronate transporter-like MFS transporter
LWLFFWYKTYDSPAAKLKSGQLKQAEYDFIHSDQDEAAPAAGAAPAAKVGWGRLLTFRQTWAFALGKFLTDPIWWFYMFWLPAFLNDENARRVAAFKLSHPGFTGANSEVPGFISWTLAVAVVYTISTFGSIFGGWLPKHFAGRGMDMNKARKLSMFIFALGPLAVLFASKLGEIHIWLAVLTLGVATASHQAWSANIFTTVSDMFPKRTVASVTGIGGMAGGIGGILIARAAGVMLAHYTTLGKIEVAYGILFVICGSAYLVAWVVMHLLVPKFALIELGDK